MCKDISESSSDGLKYSTSGVVKKYIVFYFSIKHGIVGFWDLFLVRQQNHFVNIQHIIIIE